MNDLIEKYKRRFCVVTGGRADYGLLFWILKEIEADPDLILQLVITGMHLSETHGLTYTYIEQDGFSIDARIDLEQENDTPQAITKAIGIGTIKFSEYLAQHRPDVLIVLGDRFELLSVVTAAMMARIPVAHISGGEVTEGAIDDSIRHAVTKIAKYHFVATDVYRERVIRMGESPDRVLNFGEPALDNIARLQLFQREEVERKLNRNLVSPVFLVTYHPATLSDSDPAQGINALLAALEHFPEATIIFTGTNSDAGGQIIAGRIRRFVEAHQNHAMLRASLGQLLYLSVMRCSDVVIGNSSSAIVEAPALKTASVNIGNRQKGRLLADSIITCPEDAEAIVASIEKVLSPWFRRLLPTAKSLYGAGDASRKIVGFLKEADLATPKTFYDPPAGSASQARIGGDFEITVDQLTKRELNPLPSVPLAHSLWVDSGRSAIRIALREILIQGGKRIAYLPRFSCTAVLQPFRQLDFEIRFYSMGADLRSPSALPEELSGCTVLFIHYFGTVNHAFIDQLAAHRQRSSPFYIIEDCVQAPLTTGIGHIGDFSVTSYRKIAFLPDGGLLGARNPIGSPLGLPDEQIISQRLLGKILRGGHAQDESFLGLLEAAEQKLNLSRESRALSWASGYLMRLTNLPAIAARRRDNWKVLDAAIGKLDIDEILRPLLQLADNEVPLGYPIVVRRGLRDSLRQFLFRNKIFCPIHWPVDEGGPEGACSADLQLSRAILTIPIDQRLDAGCIARLASRLEEFSRGNRKS